MDKQNEIDWLLEIEFRLQSDLDKVHERLEAVLLLGQRAVHLTLIRGGK